MEMGVVVKSGEAMFEKKDQKSIIQKAAPIFLI